MRRLEGPELVAYDVLPRALAKRVRVVEVSVLPNGADGMTVGTVVFVRDDRSTDGTGEMPLARLSVTNARSG